jgi:hypothetical protein
VALVETGKFHPPGEIPAERLTNRSLEVGGAGVTWNSKATIWPVPTGLGLSAIEIDVGTVVCALMGAMTKRKLALTKLKIVSARKTAFFILFIKLYLNRCR